MKFLLRAIIIFVFITFSYFSYKSYNSYSKLVNNAKKSTTLTEQLHNGDIIFQISTSAQSKAIQLATHSQYSHMGIICKEGDSYFVYEAVQPVKLTPIQQWINRGKDAHFVVKRLKDADLILNQKVLSKMKSIGEGYVNKDYDLTFEWSDDKMYCSELVWKIYKEAADIEIGALQKLSEFDLSSPEVKAKMKERYGYHIPENEWVISPAAMFESDQLIEVLRK